MFTAHEGSAQTPATEIAEPGGTRPWGAVAASPWRVGHVTAARLGLDLLAILLALLVAAMSRSEIPAHPDPTAAHLRFGLAVVPIWLLSIGGHGLYRELHINRRPEEFRRLLRAAALAVGIVAVLAIALDRPLNGLWLPLWFAVALPLLVVEREAVRWAERRLRSRGALTERVVVVGSNRDAAAIVETLRARPDYGVQVVAVVADDAEIGSRVGDLPVVGRVQSMLDVVGHFGASGVMVVATALDSPAWNRVASEAGDAGLRLDLIVGLRDTAPERIALRPVGHNVVGHIQGTRLYGWRRAVKRTIDIAISAVGLVLAAPVLLAAMAAIRFDTHGPMLFRQERLGQHGRPFRILKLRTMVAEAEALRAQLLEHNEADGPLFKMVIDPRVTRVGRVLRKLSIDELPQLWNVLRGDMSLVGPRPALPSERKEWDKSLFPRLRVKPGITGLWQVAGRSSSSFDDYARLDLYYVRNWSFATDLAILVRTVPAVLFRRGAF